MQNAVVTLLKSDDVAKIEQEANEVVVKMSSTGQQQMDKMIDQLGTLGENTQMAAGQALDTLRQPVKHMMDGQHGGISQTLLQLRSHVDELNPNGLTKRGGLSNLISKITKKSPLTNYIRKYESIQTQIDNIVTSLYHGKDKLQADTIGLKQLKIAAQDKVYELEKRVYFGRKLMELMEVEINKPEREHEKPLLEKGMVKVVSRVNNMMQMINVLQQSVASVDIIAENNDKLEEAVFNAITMTKNIVTVSASIQLALRNQQQVIHAVNSTNEAISEMIKSNAATLRSNTEQTNKMLEQPSIAIETLKQAFEDTLAAIHNTEDSNRRIIDSGKQFVNELDKFNKDMRQKLEYKPSSALPPSSGTQSVSSLLD